MVLLESKPSKEARRLFLEDLVYRSFSIKNPPLNSTPQVTLLKSRPKRIDRNTKIFTIQLQNAIKCSGLSNPT